MSVTGFPFKYTGVETHRRIVRNSRAAPTCTAETVRGTYGSAAEGINLITMPGQTQPVPAPYSGIGAFAIDGRGGITGGSTASTAGELAEVELVDASVQVLPDCTGYATYRVKPKGAPAALPGLGITKLVILENGEEIRGVEIQAVAGKLLLPSVWKRTSKEGGPVGW